MFKKKSFLMLVSLMAVLCVTVGGTLAYLVTESDSVVNTFMPTSVTTTVDEEIEGQLKSDVSIKNTGNTSAYIRASVVITWKNEKGDIYGGKAPAEGTDYTITYADSLENPSNATDPKWVLSSDGFYYWTQPVAENNLTGILIEKCQTETNTSAPSGYYLSVEIIGSGIQSKPTNVVTDIWNSGVSGIANDGKTLTIKTN